MEERNNKHLSDGGDGGPRTGWDDLWCRLMIINGWAAWLGLYLLSRHLQRDREKVQGLILLNGMDGQTDGFLEIVIPYEQAK